MMSYLICSECQHIEDQWDIRVSSEWNPDIPGYQYFLLCQCGSREGSFEAAHECDACGDLAPLVDHADLCADCEAKAIDLERCISKLEDEHYERCAGLDT